MLKGNTAKLRGTYDVLVLCHHRNSNQHRHSTFWRWVSMLKRCLEKLIRALNVEDMRHVQARIFYLNEILLPRSYA